MEVSSGDRSWAEDSKMVRTISVGQGRPEISLVKVTRSFNVPNVTLGFFRSLGHRRLLELPEDFNKVLVTLRIVSDVMYMML